MPDFDPENPLHVIGYVFVEYYKQIMKHLSVTQKQNVANGKYKEENLYEMGETMMENEECGKLMLFLRTEAAKMTDAAKVNVKRVVTIDVDDVSHEKLIMAILTYNYHRHQVFDVQKYVSLLKLLVSLLI